MAKGKSSNRLEPRNVWKWKRLGWRRGAIRPECTNLYFVNFNFATPSGTVNFSHQT